MFENLIARVRTLIADVKSEVSNPTVAGAADILDNISGLLRDGKSLFDSWFGSGGMKAVKPMECSQAVTVCEQLCSEKPAMGADEGEKGPFTPLVLQALWSLIQALLKKYFPSAVA